MKAGILTFHNALNYGAILQTYALQHSLGTMGCDVQILNYENRHVKTNLSCPRLRQYHNPLKYIRDKHVYAVNMKKAYKLQRFSNRYLKVTVKLGRDDLKKAGNLFDVVFTGSDQVWNDNITHSDDTYYLDFVSPEKRCSYAASIGNDKIDLKDIPRVYRLLREYSAISVRENQAKNALETSLGLNAERVLDPTLLLRRDDYQRFISEKSEKYILLYMLLYSETLVVAAKEYSRKLKCPVYCVNASGKTVHGVQDYSDVGIEEWLTLIDHAQYIFTNSFHGVAFSINFGKQFSAELPPARIKAGSRISDLLDILGLQDRILGKAAHQVSIDYTKVSYDLEKERKNSTAFLEKAVQHMVETTHKEIDQSIVTIMDDHCCGCGACVSACPMNAIQMVADEDGFARPSLDVKMCVNCGRCRSICPFSQYETISHEIKVKAVYAARSNRPEVLKISSSGGVFYSVAESILKQEGVVYGAAFDDKFILSHKRVTKIDDIIELLGSKYAQSNAYVMFPQVQKDLAEGKKVLFVGTPCQVAALRKLCKKNENLYLIDFVCHGVPSPRLVPEHIKYVEGAFGSKVKRYIPRSKIAGWGHNELFVFKNGKEEYLHPITQAYKTVFHKNLSIRSSCFNCPFTNFDRPGDLTIADFWGIGEYHPELFLKMGFP